MPLLILTVKLPNIFVARFNVVPTDFELTIIRKRAIRVRITFKSICRYWCFVSGPRTVVVWIAMVFIWA